MSLQTNLIKRLIKESTDHKHPHLEPHPIEKMREPTEPELRWEYDREYGVYAQPEYHGAFKDWEDFKNRYNKAPLTHIPDQEHHNINYSSASGVLNTPPQHRMQTVKQIIGKRRDVDKIADGIQNGKIPPPIYLRRNGRLRILAGNTRTITGIALGKSIPSKIIDVD
jgi:hypothetical protein